MKPKVEGHICFFEQMGLLILADDRWSLPT